MTNEHTLRILTAVALATTAAAQTGWVQRLPTTRPTARSQHAMTFDLARGTTLMFGGMGVGQFSATLLGDTWEWNGVNWAAKSTAHSPPVRCDHALAADIGRGRVVLFGGWTSFLVDLNDTWEYDGNDWVQFPTQTQPSVRRLARMEYDAARARVVLFGGGLGNSGVPAYSDTWEWNGIAWALRTPATSPPERWAHGMAYDFARARVVLTGGRHGSLATPDTWTWDGTNWTQLALTAPAPRGFGLANDVVHDVVVQFGGEPSDYTWLFDHTSWRRDPRTLVPPARVSAPLAHDLLRGRTVLFGGSPATSFHLDDTWEYDPGVIARWTPSGSGCPGVGGGPTLRNRVPWLPIGGRTFALDLGPLPSGIAAISIGLSDQQWNGNPLPFDLGAIGMPGCTLHVSPDFLFFAPVPVTGLAVTLTWQLPNDPGLIGTRFFDQGFALAPGVNPLGAVVSNAGVGVIGPF